jgi:FdhD protein
MRQPTPLHSMSRTDFLPEQAVTRELQVVRHRGGEIVACRDTVAEEFPVALVFNGISHAVMMATPQDLEAFAEGFSLSEGIVARRQDIHDIEINWLSDGVEVQLTVAQPAFLRLKEMRRTLAGRTGCGVCGTESLSLLDLHPERVMAVAGVTVDEALIRRILEALPERQPLTIATGCAHAAAWCSSDGEIVRVFEDIGRHNALDKLIGWLARHQVDTTSGLVFLTSRASYELVRKAARVGLPILATVSAPTTLAIRIAHDAGIRLFSFCRTNGFVAY